MPGAFGYRAWIDGDRVPILRIELKNVRAYIFVAGANHMTTGPRGLSALVIALTLFGLAGSIVVVTIPQFFVNSQPSFAVFLGAGAAVIILTAGLFGYIDRLGLGFGKTVLVLVVGYNALIAAVKLGLAPRCTERIRSRHSTPLWAIRTACGSISGSARRCSCSTCWSSG